jgi:hypothetical protein
VGASPAGKTGTVATRAANVARSDGMLSPLF